MWLTLLDVVSELDEDHGLGSFGFSEVSDVQERTLGQLVNGDVSEPNVESLVLGIQQAGECAMHLGPVQSDS